jgi:N-acetyl-beta-hexosaminidase
MDMSVTEKLVISNHGNASAKFTWKFGENSSFVPEPKFDEVPAGGHKTVVVTFRPSGTKSVEEGLILQIEDGQHQEVKCVGMINESACIFKEKMLEFGNIPVGLKSRDSILTMKN